MRQLTTQTGKINRKGRKGDFYHWVEQEVDQIRKFFCYADTTGNNGLFVFWVWLSAF
jgi:hypothetical protein